MPHSLKRLREPVADGIRSESVSGPLATDTTETFDNVTDRDVQRVAGYLGVRASALYRLAEQVTA